jgi:hypothetical protein
VVIAITKVGSAAIASRDTLNYLINQIKLPLGSIFPKWVLITNLNQLDVLY